MQINDANANDFKTCYFYLTDIKELNTDGHIMKIVLIVTKVILIMSTPQHVVRYPLVTT